MDVLGTKILVMFLLAAISFLLGLIPWKLRRFLAKGNYGCSEERGHVWQRCVQSCVLCFGAGVLFAITMVHILPEVRSSLSQYGADFGHVPMAEIIVCLGFFLLYLAEELIEQVCIGKGDNVHGHSHSFPDRATMELERAAKPEPEVLTNGTSSTEAIHKSEKGHPTGQNAFSWKHLLTFLALSLHAVFEGLAVGLEQHAADVWKLFAGVSCHKFALSFSFALELVAHGTAANVYVTYVTIFAVISSVGIGAGAAIDEIQSDDVGYYVTVGALQALAGGIILYVVVFEVLVRERAKTDLPGLWQLLAVVLGFGAMLAIDLLAEHDHDHGDHGNSVDHEEHEDHGDHDHGDHDHEYGHENGHLNSTATTHGHFVQGLF